MQSIMNTVYAILNGGGGACEDAKEINKNASTIKAPMQRYKRVTPQWQQYARAVAPESEAYSVEKQAFLADIRWRCKLNVALHHFNRHVHNTSDIVSSTK